MEYSSSAPRPLPGIPLSLVPPAAGGGSDSSTDSHDYREDASPVRTPPGGCGARGAGDDYRHRSVAVGVGGRSGVAAPGTAPSKFRGPHPPLTPTPSSAARSRSRRARRSLASKGRRGGRPPNSGRKENAATANAARTPADGTAVSPAAPKLRGAAGSLVAPTPTTALERVECLVAHSLDGLAGALAWNGGGDDGDGVDGGDGGGGNAPEDDDPDGSPRSTGDSVGSSLVSDSSPDLPAFGSAASSPSLPPGREVGEGRGEQTAVLDMAADYFRRMEARADATGGYGRGSPRSLLNMSSSSHGGGSDAISSDGGSEGCGTVVADRGDGAGGDARGVCGGGNDADGSLDGGAGEVIHVGLADISGILRDVDDLLAEEDGGAHGGRGRRRSDRPQAAEDGLIGRYVRLFVEIASISDGCET